MDCLSSRDVQPQVVMGKVSPLREACEKSWVEVLKEVLMIWPPSWRVRVVELAREKRMAKKVKRGMRGRGCIV